MLGHCTAGKNIKTLESLLDQICEKKRMLDEQFGVCGVLYQQLDEPESWKESTFNPEVHLAPEQAPGRNWTFQDLGIEKPASASSDIAGTAPFPFFTLQSIPLIRKALLNPRYLASTAAIFGGKTLIIRNTAAHSPFFRQMWTHPYVIKRLSQAAGVALEPVMETMELGHANVQVDFSKYAGLSRKEMLNRIAYEFTSHTCNEGDILNQTERSVGEIEQAIHEQSLLPWHLDSYPWVAVAMVSDSSKMVGGETVIQCGDGGYMGIAQPGMGSIMMLQGGLVRHLALGSSSPCDRITIITSFRARAVGIYDSSFMSNIRCYADLPELYRQWIDYRLDRLEPGIKKLNDRRRFIKVFGENDLQVEAEEKAVLKEYAKRTVRQMVNPSLVESLVDRLGCAIFYYVRDDYVSGVLFKHPLAPCQLCKARGAMVEKVHLSVCPMRHSWRRNSPIWCDLHETSIALENESGLELRKRMEELQVKDVILKWRVEGRPWGILDELAVQGLGEYMIEFLELSGMHF